MKKPRLKKLIRIAILSFVVSLFLWSCQKEDSNHSNSDLENKTNSISQVSIDDILSQNSLSGKEFGLKSKNEAASKNNTNTPVLKLSSSKGLKKIGEEETNYVFLMERTDKTDSYFYNLVVRERDGKLEKFIYKYPLDKSEPIRISKINNVNDQSGNKSSTGKVPVTTTTDVGGGCTKAYTYDVTPCPCVGHTDPEICQCQIGPIWQLTGGPHYMCIDINNYLLVSGGSSGDPDIDTSNGVSTIDQFGCVRNSQGLAECPPGDGNPDAVIPDGTLPVLEPDLGNPFEMADSLELTNSQRDWLDLLQNRVFKYSIGEFLLEHKLTDQFNHANAFAIIAIMDLMSDPTIKIDLNESFLSPYRIDLELVRPTIFNPDPVKTRFMCIYNKLLKSPKFKKLFVNTFGDSENLHVKYKMVDNISPVGTSTEAPLMTTTSSLTTNPTTGEVTKFNALIEINKSLIVNVSNIALAKTILHESLHAYLKVKQYKCAGTSLGILNDIEISELLNMYHSTACPQQGDHEFMFEYLLPTMAEILADIKDDLIPQGHQTSAETSYTFIDENNPSGPELPWNWNQFFEYLSIAGLHKSNAFKNSIENTPSKLSNYNIYRDAGVGAFSKDYCQD